MTTNENTPPLRDPDEPPPAPRTWPFLVLISACFYFTVFFGDARDMRGTLCFMWMIITFLYIDVRGLQRTQFVDRWRLLMQQNRDRERAESAKSSAPTQGTGPL